MSMVEWVVYAGVVAIVAIVGGHFARRVGGTFFKALFILALLGGVALVVAPYAHAGEKPWTPVGSTVTFEVLQSQGAPEGIGAAVSAAYAEIAPLANLTIMVESAGNPGTSTVEWRFSDPMAGIDLADGDTSDKDAITEVTARVHMHSGAAPKTGPAVGTMIRRDIGRDMGLVLTAPGGKLSKADKALIVAAVKAQTASTPTPAATGSAGPTTAPVTPGDTATATAAAPVASHRTQAPAVAVTSRDQAIGYTVAGVVTAGLILLLIRNRARARKTKTRTARTFPALPAWTPGWIQKLSGRS